MGQQYGDFSLFSFLKTLSQKSGNGTINFLCSAYSHKSKVTDCIILSLGQNIHTQKLKERFTVAHSFSSGLTSSKVGTAGWKGWWRKLFNSA